MLDHLVARSNAKTVPIVPIDPTGLKTWLAEGDRMAKNWISAAGFTGKPGQVCTVPGADGQPDRVLLGAPKPDTGEMWAWAALAGRLPVGRYRIDGELDKERADAAALGWALGCYEFTRYRKPRKKRGQLVWPAGADRARVTRLAEGIALTRDLITTPAGDMGPAELADAAKALAKRHRGKCATIVGKALLDRDYPAVHAVGRAAAQEPRLIDITWGNARHKKLTLVGKGVCFDSGGLDLKSPGNMLLMKKDMGGAATILGLAHAIMDAKLKVRLRVLIPAVENSVSGNAFHPLDVLNTRKGITVEVGNTDAEGRLILCDALAEADSDKPDLIIDMATLTGAARVALGTELPALFCNDDQVADALLAAGRDCGDEMWRMPLHTPYRKMLDSAVADISNVADSRFGGAITAALFLREFVSARTRWIHVDTMAYNTSNKPGRPKGGEAFGLRALFTLCERRYGRARR